ncbi:MAG: response regulator [Blastocatellia bacterium]|nr:response regulator [Blastocatellia bacterium]
MAKILLVEDDRVVSRLIENLLHRKGHIVRILADGRSAFDFITDGGEIPDLVLLDLMLPFIDGFALLKYIRAVSSLAKCADYYADLKRTGKSYCPCF